MLTITEKKLTFHFPETWQVNQYDKPGFYRRKVHQCQGTGAVDILALSEEKGLFLIEVKDFRGYRIENKTRFKNGELSIEVSQKVRDTLIGLYGAYRCQETVLAPFCDYLFAHSKLTKDARYKRKMTAILFLEEDILPVRYENPKQVHEELRHRIQIQLKFLQVRSNVHNKETFYQKLGIQVTG
ncbi:MAG: hypothetical protein VSS75_010985 [Candidatus Parabeggiatoa sp.]|nr:hypothetical protein [Candidatus Parabeggiatoa sp.]